MAGVDLTWTSPAPPAVTDARLQAAFRTRLRRASYVPLVIMLLFASALAVAVEQLLSRARWVDHTHAVIAQADRCLLLAVDIETGLRGFQITGDPEFLAPLETARAARQEAWQQLLTLVADNPRQKARAAELWRRVEDYLQFADQVAARRRTGQGVLEPSLNREAKARFDGLRSGFRALIDEEQRLLDARAGVLARRSRADVLVRFVGAAAVGALLALFIRRQLHHLSGDYESAMGELRQSADALRASEERYRELNADLEERVALRTNELSLANERLQEVDRLKSEFLASMSHELRTPLNSIIGFTEIIHGGLAGPVNAEQATQLAMVLNSARHLLHLINDLLDLARIESGRVEPVRDWCDGREVIDEALGTLRPLAARKQLALEAEFSGDTRVFTDRKMLFQIVLNLANNALKFTEQGRVRIRVTREDATLRVAVEDTGVGIKEENLPLLFESFRQIDGSARRRVEGTGLGLYLCKRLCGILGGEITVHSRFGAGSIFTVSIPANPAP